jgi:DNA primase
MISIPEYFTRFIDRGVDLNKTPKICCPFHHEDTPSFSFSSEKGVWRCFGACKDGGDVIALHRRNYKLKSRQLADESLYQLLGLRAPQREHKIPKGMADRTAVAHKAAHAKALMVAVTPDDWDELDYIVGQYPADINKLEAFYNCRRA